MTKFVREHTEAIAKYIPSWFKDNWITILTIIALTWIVFVTVQVQQKASASETSKLGLENQKRINEIQADRIEARLTICRELNKLKISDRQDKDRQIKASEKFLKENPNGIPGISNAVIRRSIRQLRKRYKSEAPVNCMAFVKNPNAPLSKLRTSSKKTKPEIVEPKEISLLATVTTTAAGSSLKTRVARLEKRVKALENRSTVNEQKLEALRTLVCLKLPTLPC